MKIFTTFCCAALALCSAVHAQSASDHMTVHFASPVMVGDTKLPAGDCDIQVLSGTNPIIVFRAVGGMKTASVASRLAEGDQEAGAGSSVVLSRRGNDLQLSRVLLTDRVGYQLPHVE